MNKQISIMNKARLQKRTAGDSLVKKEAVELFEKYKNDPLFLSGIVLYWAEGTRLNKNYRKYQLAFTSSDSNLLIYYCKFLEKFFKNVEISDWRPGLYLYPDIKPKQTLSYWSRILKIPTKQFIKPQILSGNNSVRKKLRFGTCCV
jgi:hypothetical protein